MKQTWKNMTVCVIGASCLLFALKPVHASAKTPISGESVLTSYQLGEFTLRYSSSPKLNGVNIYQLADYYIQIGKKEGIRGDIAFAQSLRETGFFRYGGSVLPSQNNFAGLGSAKNGFATPEEGVHVQIQHLKAYANKEALNTPLVDERFRYVQRGSAPNWEDLNSKWAANKQYGQEIMTLYEKMLKEEEGVYPITNTDMPIATIKLKTNAVATDQNGRYKGVLKEGNTYTAHTLKNGVYQLENGWYVPNDSGKIDVSTGKIYIQSVVPMYKLDGTFVYNVAPQRTDITETKWDRYILPGGYYIKKSSSIYSVMGITTVLKDVRMYDNNGYMVRILKKGSAYQTSSYKNGKIFLTASGYHVLDSEAVSFQR